MAVIKLHTQSTMTQLRHVVENVVILFSLALFATPQSVIQPPVSRDATDCSQSGDAIDGTCQCDTIWHGKHCRKMRLDVAHAGTVTLDFDGITDTQSVWGAHILETEGGPDYMFFSWLKMPDNSTPMEMHQRYSRSHVAYAVRESASEPFHFVSSVLLPSADGSVDSVATADPYVVQVDGSLYALFYTAVGCADTIDESTNAGRCKRTTRNIGVATANSPKGPWRRSRRGLVNVEDFGVSMATKPALTLLPDGIILLSFAHEQGVSLAWAARTSYVLAYLVTA